MTNQFPVKFTEVYPGKYEIHLTDDAVFTKEVYNNIVEYANSVPADDCTYYTLLPTKKFDKLLRRCGFTLACLKPGPDGVLLNYYVRVND